MTIDEQRYFDNYYEMFATKGWKQFLEDIEESRKVIGDIRAIRTSEALFEAHGRLAALNLVLGFEERIRAADSDEDEGENE